MATSGEKAQTVTRAEVGNRKVIAEIAGNNRYIIVTEDIVFVGSVGIASGSFGGSKVKRYPIDSITSVDVRESSLIVEFEIIFSGGSETGSTNASFMSRANNENITGFKKELYRDVQNLATVILDLKQLRKSQSFASPSQASTPSASIPEQIKQLAELRDAGILTNDEFEEKKKSLLSKM